ncbi:MAG: rRNA maturation RNase YbeY [Suipraeoptans sp.]
MTYLFDNETEVVLSFDMKDVGKEVILHTLEFLKCPYEVEISLLITDNSNIKELNRDFREIDKATDVLSFPMIDFSEECQYDSVTEDDFNPDTGEIMLGDIVISVNAVIDQAREYGHAVRREYTFLIVHSVLHLFGYDHILEEDRKCMEEKQKEIMEYLGISR